MTQHKEKTSGGNPRLTTEPAKETIMNSIPTNTDNRTGIEVIPILTAENYADVYNRFRSRPIPDDFRERLEAKGWSADPFIDDKCVTEDGSATVWDAYLDRNRMWLQDRLSCSIKHCEGHDLIESDDWEGLYHNIISFTCPNIPSNDHSEGNFHLHLTNKEPVVSYYLKHEGELPLSQVDELINMLLETVLGLQAFQKYANELIAE